MTNQKNRTSCPPAIPSSRHSTPPDQQHQHPRRAERVARAPRSKPSHATCPYCGATLNTRSSRKLSELSTMRYLQCGDFACGRRFKAVLEIISEIVPDPAARIRGSSSLPVEHLLGSQQMTMDFAPG
ncbi:Ogr/Delta-like zinc finger [Andreprevotia lacus DSM 23236]|uniref:Ogr/Delta-like zinc finger n=1 Tax=Andreprevotia lacus DSM 23236 TaxID=1121001 RepID=A0A1W1XL55_9NEIS|nr:ogr/Delta-like zinc finger family protein [Andreprevotia lacus]SMC24271.1 Ogr/Delta-like zinc finger [Andreprevotia lacus DSM 23236]